jgi:hypothetical protein
MEEGRNNGMSQGELGIPAVLCSTQLVFYSEKKLELTYKKEKKIQVSYLLCL